MIFFSTLPQKYVSSEEETEFCVFLGSRFATPSYS